MVHLKWICCHCIDNACVIILTLWIFIWWLEFHCHLSYFKFALLHLFLFLLENIFWMIFTKSPLLRFFNFLSVIWIRRNKFGLIFIHINFKNNWASHLGCIQLGIWSRWLIIIDPLAVFIVKIIAEFLFVNLICIISFFLYVLNR
jgi:hypothetical protein